MLPVIVLNMISSVPLDVLSVPTIISVSIWAFSVPPFVTLMAYSSSILFSLKSAPEMSISISLMAGLYVVVDEVLVVVSVDDAVDGLGEAVARKSTMFTTKLVVVET